MHTEDVAKLAEFLKIHTADYAVAEYNSFGEFEGYSEILYEALADLVALEDGEKIRLPRKLVNSIHAELRGIIFKEQLEPDQCGYRCQIYEHAEVLKKYLEPK